MTRKQPCNFIGPNYLDITNFANSGVARQRGESKGSVYQ